ncbi:hypothetical protein B2J86_00430 [Acidovorax sp. SRB_14]|nr:GlsB/YeaQ/YmgE family stress response membrane protein [Acidovorax sp. SRB_14]NMM78374.1 hypothetical protein [Acidovorax sp. SRB_24]NMM78375.1 hypothetical protein [Acidovorax sp. SRB_24]NMM79408.1 hypothetical protein [Acidovorax sp. SRB_14]NMM84660.1 hypothetical protein [Rhodococcus sp. SRB_17]
MLSLLTSIVIGCATGLLAWTASRTRSQWGWPAAALVGVIGALLAGYLGVAVDWYRPGTLGGSVASLLGAMALLAVYRFLQRKL